VGDCLTEVDARWSGIAEDRRRHEALRRVFGLMVDDVLVTSQRRLDETAPQSLGDVQAMSEQVISFSQGMAGDIRTIKSFLFANMYRHHRVKRMRIKATRVVEDLFSVFMDDPTLMPPNWSRECTGDETARARVIADYIAGMTDRYALEEHRVMNDPMARA
ncbi:MAG: deoxyguanosinetriphosphate triphosphohydrolase, partial [Pseudomonadota bacterium]